MDTYQILSNLVEVDRQCCNQTKMQKKELGKMFAKHITTKFMNKDACLFLFIDLEEVRKRLENQDKSCSSHLQPFQWQIE